MNFNKIFSRALAVFLLAAPTTAFAQILVSTGNFSGLRLWSSAGNDWWIDPTAGRFDLRVNGGSTPLMTVLSGGNVGIGTTGPGVKLDVKASAGVDQTAQFQGNMATGGYVNFYDAVNSLNRGFVGYGGTLFSGYANSDFGLRSQGGLALATNGGFVREYIDVNGNVGIGTGSPAAKLHMSSGTLLLDGTTGPVTKIISQVLNNDFGGNYAFGVDPANGVLISKAGLNNNTNRVLYLARDDTNGATIMGFQTDGATLGYMFRANNSSYFMGGSVGIGTASPASKLHVRQALDQNLLVSGPLASSSGVTLIAQNDATTFAVPLELRASPLILGMNGNTVGIGTTGPASKLHVLDGDIRISTSPAAASRGIIFQDGTVQTTAGGIVAVPSRQVLTAVSGTYTTPAGARQLRIRMVGGGGGASGAHTGATAGGTGGTTSFNSITAVGGGGGTTGGVGGVGGTGGTGAASLRIAGSAGSRSLGGLYAGAVSPFGGAGSSAYNGTEGNGGSGAANSGSGGGNCYWNGGSPAYGGPGGAGEYVELIINSPAASYAYAAGAGGTAGAGACSGGAGGTGVIVVDEFY